MKLTETHTNRNSAYPIKRCSFYSECFCYIIDKLSAWMSTYTLNYFGDTVYDIRNMASKSTSKNISEEDVKLSYSDIGAIRYPILKKCFLPVFLYVAMSMTMSMSTLHEHRNRKNLDADTDMDMDTDTDTDKDIRMKDIGYQ